MTPIDVVHAYFAAMQAGPDGADRLFPMFADDAVYIEPFSGAPATHEGRHAIESHIRQSWTVAPPDVQITLNRVDVDGDTVRTEWTCTSPAFEAPIRGIDVCVVKDGLIARLEVSFA